MSSETVEQRLTEIMEKVLTALNIEGSQKDTILEEMKKYSTDLKLRIINYTNFNDHLKEMLDADEKLVELRKNNEELKGYYDSGSIKAEWDKTMEELAKLQGLIILRKVAQKDCDGLIKALLNAFNVKINAVNNILSSDLNDKGTSGAQSNVKVTMFGGSDDEKYKVKYLKYKAKYLNLMKNNF